MWFLWFTPYGTISFVAFGFFDRCTRASSVDYGDKIGAFGETKLATHRESKNGIVRGGMLRGKWKGSRDGVNNTREMHIYIFFESII